jgi:hypothetical protein
VICMENDADVLKSRWRAEVSCALQVDYHFANSHSLSQEGSETFKDKIQKSV